jgi:diaminopimelate dehydrogenase
MNRIIKVGIVGYGNLGRGVEMALKQNPDFQLEAVFTRREVSDVGANVKTLHISQIDKYKDKIDVMILCGGSASDLPEQAPQIATMFSTVDSFDNHAKIPEYYSKLDEVAKKEGTIALISAGWDPGLFSMMRMLTGAVLPEGKDYSFWGRGVSQGHSVALRRVPGVKNGIQYTVPVKGALERVRSGQNPELTTSEKHERVCYVVAEPGADKDKITESIKSIPNYFSDYTTTVNFITEEEFRNNHSGMPHGGFVIRTGKTGKGTKQKIEFGLELGSNPEFTASVLVACARAAYRLANEGKIGAYTVLDIPLNYFSPKTVHELRKELL